MVIDEIDKARGEHAYDPLGALYSLLEHDTAGKPSSTSLPRCRWMPAR